MARFGQAPKASKPPQQLSKALEPHNPPQQLSKACRLLRHGTSLGPTSCFCWASKLLCGTFSAGSKSLKTSAPAFAGVRTSHPSAAAFEGVPLAWPWYLPRPHKLFLLGFETAMRHVLGRPQKIPKASKPPQQLSQALEPHTPPQQLSKACRLLGHGTSLGPTSCFYWASKLLCGTFWARPKSLKTSAAAFDGLRTSQPSAAAFEGVPLAWPWYLPRPHKLCLFGLRNCYVARFEAPFWSPKSLKTSAAAFAGVRTSHPSAAPFEGVPLAHGTSPGPTSCFYWASKLLCGTFWAGPKSLKTSAAAFAGVRTSHPSAAAFEGVPLAWPWYPTSCFYWASKLLCGTFWAGPKSLKTSAAAFAGLGTSHPSAAAFEGVPLAWPWYLPRPRKLFLLGFETAMWHVLGRPQKLQNLRSSFRRP